MKRKKPRNERKKRRKSLSYSRRDLRPPAEMSNAPQKPRQTPKMTLSALKRKRLSGSKKRRQNKPGLPPLKRRSQRRRPLI